ncbi:MAG: NAD(P)/FAD-dependent oxidoreductase, partial [Phycicoccus sp.]
SLWWDTLTLADRAPQRPVLDGNTRADVCVVGAGYTGLWTAYELLRREPSLDVLVVEAQAVGFGASGRNGGWCSALLPQGVDALARRHGRPAALAMRTAMQRTIDEVGAVIAHEGIDCYWAKGGTIVVSRNPAQLERARAAVAHDASWGGVDDLQLLAGDQVRDRIGIPDAIGGTYTPHCARLHPTRLARGLARAIERAGARIVEGTRATSIRPGMVVTDHGTVSAAHVVRATEAWTPQLAGARREVVPVYSLVVATEPLSAPFWAQAGLARAETFSEHRNVIVYGQRTGDDRLVFGGRGAPYHFRSAVDPKFDDEPRVFAALRSALVELFPALQRSGSGGGSPVRFTHRWGGPLGIARDWHAAVRYDSATGLGSAGGYVGDGVGASNLAGRTLADLITGRDTDLVRLPWVGHRSRPWEPEPLRWLGVNAGLRMAQLADVAERRRGRLTPLSGALARLTGH